MGASSRMTAAEREVLLARLERTLAGRPDVSFAMVHGSFLNADVFRDLDLAVWLAPGAEPLADLALAVHLSRDLGLPVDVRRINDAPIPFLFHALRGRVVSVKDEALLASLMERVPREYHDIAPVLRQATKDAFAR